MFIEKSFLCQRFLQMLPQAEKRRPYGVPPPYIPEYFQAHLGRPPGWRVPRCTPNPWVGCPPHSGDF